MSAVIEADWLGDVPQPAAPVGRPRSTQTGRMRKVHCIGCGCIVYASRGALQRSGLPVCGCGERMALANLRDRAAIEWDALDAELRSYGVKAYDAAMRELGETPQREHGGAYGHGGGAQHRCEWEGGHCAKYSSARYCPEHELHTRAAMAPSSRRAA
jgi:hypothetical protein